MKWHFLIALFATIVLLGSCEPEQPRLTGDWQLQRIDGFYPTGFWPKDVLPQIRSAALDSAAKQSQDDSLHLYAPEISDIWFRYFERFHLGWFVIQPDTMPLRWSFTDQNDSELRIYDDSGHVATRLASYWSRSGSNIVFTGFFGWYQHPISFHIIALTSHELVLKLNTLDGDLVPRILYFRRISDGPGRDTHLSGTRFEDINTRVASANVFVGKENQHPFLVDHDRRLVVAMADGHIIDSRKLETDPGEGCPAFLFDAASDLLVVDCNDTYYHISKSTGAIRQVEWRWNETPAEKYLGTYRRGYGEDYLLIYDSAFVTDMHRIKDPLF